MIDGKPEVIARQLKEFNERRKIEEKEKTERLWAEEVLQSFIPRRMPLEGSRKPVGEF